MKEEAVSVTLRIDRLPLTRFHWKVLLVSGFASSFRSMNLGIISYVIASLIADWKLSPAEAGSVGSVGIAGMVLGVMLVGALADRFGRKFMLEATFVIFGIAGLLSGISWNLLSLLFFRFIAGIGFGGGSPPVLSLLSELSPSRHRGLMLLLLEGFWVTGSAGAALLAYLVIPSLGWRMAFSLGAVPLAYLFVIHWLLPESPRFLLDRGRAREAEDTVRRIEEECGVQPGGSVASLASDGASRTPPSRAGLSELWSGEYLKRTICIWILWAFVCYSYYGVFIWLPSLVVAAGFSMADSFKLVFFVTLAQVPGCIFGGFLVDRIGRKRTLVPFLLVSGASALMFGLSTGVESVLLWGSLISFFLMGAWGTMTAFTAELYPTRLRSTGLGWSGALGRLVGVIAPMATGFIVSQSAGGHGLAFASFGVILLLAGLNVAVLGEETVGQSLEELSA